MSADAALLARYLRQLRDYGERELFLDALTADELTAALSGRAPAPVAAASPAPPAAPATAPPAAAVAALDALRAELQRCAGCRIEGGGENLVFGDGDPGARLVVVGEAPGADEDRVGRPFVGRAGRFLDLMLMAVGFPRERVYICNVLKYRPPGNRDPRPEEIAHGARHLERQIEAVAPRALLAVGRFSAQTLARSEAPIGRLRGRTHDWRGVPVVATYHPAFLLRSPAAVRSAWQDFQLLRQVLDEQV